ncbi:PREDICTED: probable phospholipid hydroperoxide glutathione peroxidase [Dinoponera quadriceps]|uniref:Glutathione peroxidase n=1 Tax=Dinoponera quadriceps TaxID=609295 RepID=A0A6P3XC15_DINQU|nr:PREDICTED: probable phospholipid hydroperoxide glutathione peroxidase [Dinoponera quadriceps]
MCLQGPIKQLQSGLSKRSATFAAAGPVRMLRITSLFLLFAVFARLAELKALNQDADWDSATTIYDFHANDIEGEDVPLEKYRGNALVIVNVASNCGLTTSNYKQLQQLYDKYMTKGLRILAFPSNQFAGQEPGTNEEILNFVQREFNVTFDMFAKIDVNGEAAHPLWKWLKKQTGGDKIPWNFTKFVVDRQGNVVERFVPSTEPLGMEETLKKYL